METTQVVNFRREVLRRIAEYTWNDCLPEHIYDILYNTVKDNTSRVRCCVHKERAVLKNRIQMALWQPLGLNIINAAKAALDGESSTCCQMPVTPAPLTNTMLPICAGTASSITA